MVKAELTYNPYLLETDIKSFGTFNAEVKLYTGISANVKVMVQEEGN